MKKTVIKLLLISLMANSFVYNVSFAWASKDVYYNTEEAITRKTAYDLFYDDYTTDTEGSTPNNYEIVNTGGTSYIEVADIGNNKKKNTLVLHDTYNPGPTDFTGPRVIKRFEKQTGIVAVEFRFKTVKTNTDVSPLAVYFKNGNNEACAIMLPSDSGILSLSNGDGMTVPIAGDAKLPFDTWATVRVVLDFNNKKADTYVNGEYLINSNISFASNVKYDKSAGTSSLTNLSFRDTFNDDGFDNIEFRMSKWEGKQYIDYLKVEKNVQRMQSIEVTEIKAPIIESPMNIPSGKYININYNNEYIFLPNKPFIESGSVYVSLIDLADALGLLAKENENSFIIYKNDIESAINKNIMIFKNNVYYAPVRFTLESLNYSILWEDATKTVFVKEGK